MRVTRPGAKDNRLRLVWVKYFKYTIKGEEYYFKQKAYATYCDGLIESQPIKKQTYKNAIKRGNKCIEVSEDEMFYKGEVEHLAQIFSIVFNLPLAKMRKIIKEEMSSTQKAEKHQL